MSTETKRCSKCGAEKGIDEFHRDVHCRYGRRSTCKVCHHASARQWEAANPQRKIFYSKRGRAKLAGIPFELRFEDINWPDVCPVLGMALDYSRGTKGGVQDNSPSFDRLNPKLGYVHGNVIIVSNLANRIKTDATPEQLMRVARFYAGFNIPQEEPSHD